MRNPDIIPVAAWVLWELFLDEPHPAAEQGPDEHERQPPKVKTPPERSSK